MPKHPCRTALSLVLLSASLLLTTILVFQKQIWQKQAEPPLAEAVFVNSPQASIRPNWQNYAQGGESQQPMLAPASDQIKALQPQFIRLDHLFDFPNLDQRVEEVRQTGALPFLSLSYFPPEIAPDPTSLPPSYAEWQKLVEKTVRSVSGKTGRNLTGVYYEVWNEPDLFGQMEPETYFGLYQATVDAALRCQDCQPFFLGGPAITTLKKEWLNGFLGLVQRHVVRLDFISWHSYQVDPNKTKQEVDWLKEAPAFQRFPAPPQLIISEWGPTPEVSAVNDSYRAASHAVVTLATVSDSLDKIFAFELVDGRHPGGLKYWGRWGLLTHPEVGTTAKPRYYAFLYLNRLLPLRLPFVSISPDLYGLGSGQNQEKLTFILSQPTASNEQLGTIKLKVKEMLPGHYQQNLYSLDPLHPPLSPTVSEFSLTEREFNTEIPSYANGVYLLELRRTSAALVRGNGINPRLEDRSARASFSLPPLYFPLTLPVDHQQLKISFWFKPSWGPEEAGLHLLAQTLDDQGNGVRAWIERSVEEERIYWARFANRQQQETVDLALTNWQKEVWHHLSFFFDLAQGQWGLVADGKERVVGLPTRPQIRTGALLLIGGETPTTSAEGWFDNLKVELDSQTRLEEDFNLIPLSP